MLDLDERLDELKERGRYRRLRMVSGPQGPRVVLDGRPVLLLCSGNSLGLADHPRVREAAADAAMRWGVGAGAARVASGTMTLHRRLEERLAGFTSLRAGLLFGSGTLANLGVIPALARRGEVVLHDALCHPSLVDGCRLAGADAVAYDHGDAEHLAWTLRQCRRPRRADRHRGPVRPRRRRRPAGGDRRGSRGATTSACSSTSRTPSARSAPGGRGALADAGLEGEADVVTGSLGLALGAYGGFASCDHVTARYLVNSARTLIHSTAPAPVAVAAAMAALDLLEEQPRRIESCAPTPPSLRDGLAREGFDVTGCDSHIVPLVVGDAELAQRIVDAAVDEGVFCEAVLPPGGAGGNRAAAARGDGLPHAAGAARGGASSLARAAMRCGFRPGAGVPVAAAQERPFDGRTPSG